MAEDGGMGKVTERSAETRRMLDEYAARGLTEFCEQRRMLLTTFDYWRRELADEPRRQAKHPRLVKFDYFFFPKISPCFKITVTGNAESGSGGDQPDKE